MPIQAPRYRFMDFGQAQLTAERIKSDKMTNQAASMDLEEKQNILANRKKAQEIRDMFDGMPDQIEQMEARGLWDEAEKLRTSYMQTRMNEVSLIEGMRNGIDEGNYKETRAQLIKAGAIQGEMWPVEYSDKWFRDQIKEKKGNLQRLTKQWSEQGVTMSGDIIAQDGEILWEGTPYDSKSGSGSAGGKPWQMNASDTNSIRNATAQLYGSIWDPRTERYGGLNRQQEQEVASISEEASKIYNANQGRIPHAEAVARASRKMGITIQDLERDPGNNDPAGLFALPE